MLEQATFQNGFIIGILGKGFLAADGFYGPVRPDFGPVDAARKFMETPAVFAEPGHELFFRIAPHIPKTHIPIVLVDQTIEYQVYQHYTNNEAKVFLRPLLNIDVLKLKYWERFYWRKADKVIAVSAKDKKEMLKLEPNLKVDIVPNGVNLDLFKQKTSWQDKHPKILFVGNFN